MEKLKTREKCSFYKGHDAPTEETQQEDLLNWWEEYAARGDYETIEDVRDAIDRMRDYLLPPSEHNQYAFPEELTEASKLQITRTVLWKMQVCLGNVLRFLPDNFKRGGVLND